MKKNIGLLQSIRNLVGVDQPETNIKSEVAPISPPMEFSPSAQFGSWYAVNSIPFDGEKTIGELGAPVNVVPIYASLRARAYEADLKSDVIKIITGRFFKWVVGTGLKLQSQPNESILKSEGINEDLLDLQSKIEARYSLYTDSTDCDYSRMQNLHEKAEEAFRTAFLGGDALCILRYEDGDVNIQVIDGQDIVNPIDQLVFKTASDNGNFIQHGVETNGRGEHIAFYLKSMTPKGIEIKRIEAKTKEGRTVAWMLYGTKHRINHVRGIPCISSILEKADKLDRYTEASVAGAEERAKIAYSIEHTRYSTGESVLLDNIRQNVGTKKDDKDPYELGEPLSNRIRHTTNKQTFNMPIGSKLATIASNQEDNYPEFFEKVFMQLCAAVDIPPEVALQKYSSNYSASRAAINGWGFIINIYREKLSRNFYKRFYEFWLETEILKNKIEAGGYIKALNNSDKMIQRAYTSCKFTGLNMPHIDPLKEVKAIREMLGSKKDGIVPLISHDQATEQLNQGDWIENYKKFEQEVETFNLEIEEQENGRKEL